MTNVQLSSHLERVVARRTFPLHARTGACRNLFGPVDHEELNRDMETKLQEISDRDQSRWNFNFEKDSPLPGDYVWEETSVFSAPAFYKDSMQIGRTRIVMPVNVDSATGECGSQDAPASSSNEEPVQNSGNIVSCPSELNQENRADTLNSWKLAGKLTTCAQRKITSSELPRSNPIQMTDFFLKRKRTFETKNTERTSQHPGLSIPVEQTPRKRIR